MTVHHRKPPSMRQCVLGPNSIQYGGIDTPQPRQRRSSREQSMDMPFQCPMVVGFALRRPLLAEFARFGRGTRHARRQHNASLRAMLADGLSQLEALAVVALDVEEGEVELHVETERLEGFLVRAGLDDVVAALAQIGAERRAHQDVTVNE